LTAMSWGVKGQTVVPGIFPMRQMAFPIVRKSRRKLFRWAGRTLD
jgi:hypothetical protein